MSLLSRMVVVLGSIACSGGALAADATGDVYQGFKAETIGALFTELGAKDLKSTTIDNDPRLAFKLNENFYVVDFYECEDKTKGCKAMNFMSSYVAEPGDTVQAMNSYNLSYAYGKGAIEQDGGLLSTHLINGEFGSSKAHVLSEWNTYLGMTNVMFEHLGKYVVAHAPAGGVAPYMDAAAPTKIAARRARFAPLAKMRRP